MDSLSVQSLTVTIKPPSFSRVGIAQKPSGHVKVLKFLDSMKYPRATKSTKLKIRLIRAQASGQTKSSSGTAEAAVGNKESKDENLVFVAGATGRVGSRTVRELIKLGFRVRAGVRNAQRANALVQSVKQLKIDPANANEGNQLEKLEIVECDLEKTNLIAPALGNSSIVVCCIGASEKEVFDITGPYRIDYQATKYLIDTATAIKVDRFILITSLGTNKFGFPAAILNLFWGVLCWKRKAEEALIASGVPYTIVRPGGMERPTDAYKETHNITLSNEDTLFGGQVSNLQIAELIAVMTKNRTLSFCKIVEAIAETTAPLTPMEELLAKIPSQRAYIYSPKEPDIATVNDPAPSASIAVAEPCTATQEEAAEPKLVAERPLSPYTAYDDLKPPTSPTPTQPGGLKGIDMSDPVSKSSASDGESERPGIDSIPQTTVSEGTVLRPVSPYTAYEDLKPPTSPSLTPSVSNDKPLITSTTVELSSTSSLSGSEVAEKDSKSSNSLYPVYSEFKPPTSPSPNAPNVSLSPEIGALSGNGPAPIPVADEPNNEQHVAVPKSRPLSPYTMYEDLKPPSSPTPAPPVKK
ncbi:hypothetical protein L6164_035601 [Bauhinia variegata]|uniref:Uncharacterized protein n=1 Tax=Bauhinia variegata TaxID=167791 RepID=A0ACB9KEH6_BAUVA|nr:hypothetical protein L6164_035601 [Bauhinia variegata]